jgi:hypothetical protein
MWHFDEELGRQQALTPEGFLIVRGATIARTGAQNYHASELPFRAEDSDQEGMVSVERDAAEVFKPRSIASFEGKPIVMDHPEGMVAPQTWEASQVIGHVQNVRQGGDRLMADLFITSPRAIGMIRDGTRRGLSCGYDAQYSRAGVGRYRQHDIVGNHVALVSDPRCGPACFIGDSIRRQTEMETSRQCVERLAREWRSRKHRTRDEMMPRPTGILPTPPPIDPKTGVVIPGIGWPVAASVARMSSEEIAEAWRTSDSLRCNRILSEMNRRNRAQWG